MMTDITLIPVQEHEKDEFIRALQQSFRLAVADDLDDGEEVISREEIEESMNAPKSRVVITLLPTAKKRAAR